MALNLDWFPFFHGDFDEGTRGLTNEEVGAYLRLLSFQWRYGSIPADPERAGRITGERFSESTWKALQEKFKHDPSVPGDRLVNLRMRKERIEAERRYERRARVNRKNGSKGGLAKRMASESLANGQRIAKQVASESLSDLLQPAENHKEILKLSAQEPPAADWKSPIEGHITNKEQGGEERREPKSSNGGGSSSESPVARPNSRARRSRRAPEGYEISEELGKWVQTKFPSTPVDTLRAWTAKQLEKFLNHEFAAPRSDWDATFRNWVLGCIDRGHLPAGTRAAAGDEEKAWQETLKTASIFGATRGSDESREQFTKRVNDMNQRRLSALEQRKT
jgi:uncharacterized protein YdaU (DUF1376 family)